MDGCLVIQEVNFPQKCLCMFAFLLRILYTDPPRCPTCISSIINTKYLCQTRPVLSIFYMTETGLYCLFKTFRIVPPNMVEAANSSAKKVVLNSKQISYIFRSPEEWALEIDQTLRKNWGERGRERGRQLLRSLTVLSSAYFFVVSS